MYQKVTLHNIEFYLQIQNIRISTYGTVVFKTDAPFSGGRGFKIFARRSANEVFVVFLGPYVQIQGRLKPREDRLLPHSLHYTIH
jgi:hypothetical protein